ncbi:MAG: HIT family protein [Candidatus Woesearchaeota archaeon]
MDDCIFCKIIKGEIPCQKVYEDNKVLAFLDINPVNKGHALVVPKKHSADLTEANDEDLAAVISACRKIANACMKGLGAEGVCLEANSKPAAGQIVMHTHFHVVPRWKNDGLRHWPGKKLSDEEMKKAQEAIKKALQ